MIVRCTRGAASPDPALFRRGVRGITGSKSIGRSGASGRLTGAAIPRFARRLDEADRRRVSRQCRPRCGDRRDRGGRVAGRPDLCAAFERVAAQRFWSGLTSSMIITGAAA